MSQGEGMRRHHVGAALWLYCTRCGASSGLLEFQTPKAIRLPDGWLDWSSHILCPKCARETNEAPKKGSPNG